MFRVIASMGVAVIVLMQVDQYLYSGRYTGATFAVLRQVSMALGVY